MEVLHYPRLDTILMVEKTIKKIGCYPTKTELWKALPKKVMYQSFCLILEYLEDSGKILYTPENKILWTHNPELLRMSVPAE